MSDVSNSRLFEEFKGIQSIKDALIVLIKTEWNAEIVDELEKGCLRIASQYRISTKTVVVPGAVEIPLVAQLLAKENKHQAIICLGAVIRGETTHYNYVCEQVSEGCQRVMLDYSIPVIFGVLTTENEEQAQDRVGGAHGHKGKDAVDAAITMVNIVNQLTTKQDVSIGYY